MKMTILSLFLALALTGTARAQIPTIDIQSIIQTGELIVNTAEQLDQMRRQIELQIRRYDLQQQQYEASTGNYNMGDLLNSEAYREARRFIPRSWQETLELLEGAQAANHQRQSQEAARSAREAGQRYSTSDLYEDDALDKAVRYGREARSVFTQIGVGQSNFDQSAVRTENIEFLIDQIDSAPDLKAATDLQNRLSAENAQLLGELIQLQSAGQINAGEIRLNNMNRRAEDVRMSRTNIPLLSATPNN
ncbi:MAG: hypothetical protein JKY40_10485 [Gammaproteobacteria bacterium]|nr:hypothetical protein [Gammaproteobacteria bacterium]MBL4729712.1 hypothetical protein [Gammaproteobacteria bacterium]